MSRNEKTVKQYGRNKQTKIGNGEKKSCAEMFWKKKTRGARLFLDYPNSPILSLRCKT
jgi:hypothetical protein